MTVRVARSVLAAVLVLAVPSAARAFVIKEYPLDANTFPNFLVVGSDGNIWFTEAGKDRVGKITPAGVMSHDPVATAGCTPVGLVSLGVAIWYTCTTLDKIGFVYVTTGAGYDLDASPRPAGPIAADGEENLWYTAASDTVVAEGTPIHSGLAGSSFFGIAYDRRGNMLAADQAHARYIAASSLTSTYGGSADLTGPPYLVAVCTDNKPWFTIPSQNFIEDQYGNGHGLQMGGAVEGIACGPDGSLWFTDPGTNRIGRFDPGSSTFETFPVPTPNATPYGIVVGPDGSVWFTENTGQKIGRLWLRPPGDTNGDGTLSVADVFYLINFLFAGGPEPVP